MLTRNLWFMIWTFASCISTVEFARVEAQTVGYSLGSSNRVITQPVLISVREPSFLQDSDKKELDKKELDKKDLDKRDLEKKDSDEDTTKLEAKKDPDAKSGGKNQSDKPTKSGGLAPITMQSVRDPIGAANISVAEIGTKVLPENEAAKERIASQTLPGGAERGFSYVNFRWQASNNGSLPLYFEEPMLERHGQQLCPTYLQPAVSGTKFLSNLILYPYKATLHPALECRYSLGHFRPGSAAPCLRDTLPWSPRAAVVQGFAVTGVAVGLPW